jgi:hypothetical protein
MGAGERWPRPVSRHGRRSERRPRPPGVAARTGSERRTRRQVVDVHPGQGGGARTDRGRSGFPYRSIAEDLPRRRHDRAPGGPGRARRPRRPHRPRRPRRAAGRHPGSSGDDRHVAILHEQILREELRCSARSGAARRTRNSYSRPAAKRAAPTPPRCGTATAGRALDGPLDAAAVRTLLRVGKETVASAVAKDRGAWASRSGSSTSALSDGRRGPPGGRARDRGSGRGEAGQQAAATTGVRARRLGSLTSRGLAL